MTAEGGSRASGICAGITVSLGEDGCGSVGGARRRARGLRDLGKMMICGAMQGAGKGRAGGAADLCQWIGRGERKVC